MLELNSFLLSTENPKKLVEFYEKVFEKKAEWEDESYSGFQVGKCFISIGIHDKIKGDNKQPERFIFNLDTDDVKGEFERIKKLGAKVIAEPYKPSEDYDMWIATFADPDGNYFQLTTPWKE